MIMKRALWKVISSSPFECAREQGFCHIFYTSVWIWQREGARHITNMKWKEKEAEGGAAEHPVWSSFEMTWPSPLSDRIDFLYLILFLHLLWHYPLRYVRASAASPSPTSTSPKSAYALASLSAPQLTIPCFSVSVRHEVALLLISILCLTYSPNTIYWQEWKQCCQSTCKEYTVCADNCSNNFYKRDYALSSHA